MEQARVLDYKTPRSHVHEKHVVVFIEMFQSNTKYKLQNAKNQVGWCWGANN